MNWTYVRPYVQPLVGSSMVVLSGAGVGQYRRVVAFDNSSVIGQQHKGLITLDEPLDGFVNASSVIAVVPSIGSKNIVGNTLSWSGVAQFYGTTLGGVFADNDLRSVNVQTIYDGINGASMRVSGLCYYGAQPNFFTEIIGNNLVDSDGVGFFSEAQSRYQANTAMCNIDYSSSVPWVRWGVARHNTISGISDAARYRNASAPACGGVKIVSDRIGSDSALAMTDIVTEHNFLDCPAPGVLPGDQGIDVINPCLHCSVRP